jgi:hypothetical protein
MLAPKLLFKAGLRADIELAIAPKLHLLDTGVKKTTYVHSISAKLSSTLFFVMMTLNSRRNWLSWCTH